MFRPKISINILESSGRLTPLKPLIRQACKDVFKIVPQLISLPNIDIIFEDNKEATIPEEGVGGGLYHVNRIDVPINPDFPNIEKGLDQKIKSTLAHEMNHSARENVYGFPKTLLDALVEEGLADHFDLEVNGGMAKPWSTSLDKKKIKTMMKRAEKEFDNENYDHCGWFFGDPKLKIPRWTGYALGFKIVGEYLEKNNKKASEVTLLESKKFLRK